MKITPKRVFAVLAGAAVLALAGCTTLVEEDPNAQAVPWSQPADWEGQVPGMSGR